MPKIFVISGPSGVGKGTIVRALVKKPELNLVWGTTYTTRPTRPSDSIENHYAHVSQEQFKNLEQNGEIFESNFFNGCWYGSSKKLLDEQINWGKNVIVELDVNGGLNYKKTFPESVLIFVTAPLDQIKQRLETRGQNTTTEIEGRLETAKNELAIANQYDYVVKNPQGKPQQAIDKISEIIYSHIR